MQILGDDTLCGIARELVTTVRGNVTIDWTLRENVRANLRRLVKRILRKHGYPPDKQEAATRTVLVVCPLNKLTLDLRGVSTVRAGIAVRRPVRPRASNRKIISGTYH